MEESIQIVPGRVDATAGKAQIRPTEDHSAPSQGCRHRASRSCCAIAVFQNKDSRCQFLSDYPIPRFLPQAYPLPCSPETRQACGRANCFGTWSVFWTRIACASASAPIRERLAHSARKTCSVGCYNPETTFWESIFEILMGVLAHLQKNHYIPIGWSQTVSFAAASGAHCGNPFFHRHTSSPMSHSPLQAALIAGG